MNSPEDKVPPSPDAPASTGENEAPNRFAEPALLWFLLLVGAIPVVGFAIGSGWSIGEVGVGTVFVIFATWQLASEAYRRSRHHHRHAQDGHAGHPSS